MVKKRLKSVSKTRISKTRDSPPRVRSLRFHIVGLTVAEDNVCDRSTTRKHQAFCGSLHPCRPWTKGLSRNMRSATQVHTDVSFFLEKEVFKESKEKENMSNANNDE